MEGHDPLMDELPVFLFCPEHSRIDDSVRSSKDMEKSLEDRVADLTIAHTKLETTVTQLVTEIKEDREDRKEERMQEAEEREKDRQAMQKNIEFYQGLVTCNNKASIEERKEIIKYGVKVILILLMAVVGIKVVTAAVEVPFP
ncbi:MAG: hypothetical protein SA339_10235 [Methanomassiliicoccus sp.]|nr:hypothetical protein [Methanomassiliicoccus sp.]